jgi:hypothetical protein
MRGILYAPTSTNSNPQLGGTGVTEIDDVAGGTGTFMESVKTLSPDTAYSFVAFATNSAGTSYSTVSTFTTLPGLTVPGPQTADENVGLTIGSIMVAAPASASLTVTLSVGHGTLSLGTTSRLSISSKGGTLKLVGSTSDLNTALATLTYLPAHDYSGPDTLSVGVNDSGRSASGMVTITVKSITQQTADLRAKVLALTVPPAPNVPPPLNAGQANSLIVKLNLIGNAGDIDRVQSFLAQVQDFLASGILTQTQADSLLGPGDTLLLSVTRR